MIHSTFQSYLKRVNDPLVASVLTLADVLAAPKKDLTVNEVAERLNVSAMTVYRLLREQQLPSYRVGRNVRITLDAVNNYILSTSPRQ